MERLAVVVLAGVGGASIGLGGVLFGIGQNLPGSVALLTAALLLLQGRALVERFTRKKPPRVPPPGTEDDLFVDPAGPFGWMARREND